MSKPTTDLEALDQIVESKVKRIAAKKAMHYLQHEVDQINRQAENEKRNLKIIIPLILLLGLGFGLMVTWG